MNVSFYLKGDYEDFHALRQRKNKANFTCPKGVEQSSGTGRKNNRSEHLFIDEMMQKFHFSTNTLVPSGIILIDGRTPRLHRMQRCE